MVDCSDEQRAYFKIVAFEPTKWTQSPYGDERKLVDQNSASWNQALSWLNLVERLRQALREVERLHDDRATLGLLLRIHKRGLPPETLPGLRAWPD